MTTKVILNADLYDNVLTEKLGDYVSKPCVTGSFHNPDIAAGRYELSISTQAAAGYTLMKDSSSFFHPCQRPG